MSSPEADFTVHGIHRTTIDSDVSNSTDARTIAAGSGDMATIDGDVATAVGVNA